MSAAIRILLALISLTLLAAGVMWAFAPASNMEANSIAVSSALGMNMIKSDVGAPLLAAGSFVLLYALRQGHWYYPSVIIAALYAVVRTVSVAVDGPSQMAVVGVGLEVLTVVLLVVHRKVFNGSAQ